MNSSNCQTVSGNLKCRAAVGCCQFLIRIVELYYLISKAVNLLQNDNVRITHREKTLSQSYLSY